MGVWTTLESGVNKIYNTKQVHNVSLFSFRVMIDGGTTLLTFNVTSQSFPCLRISSNIGNAHLGKSSLRKRTTESSAILFSCYFSNCIRKPSTESTFNIYDKGGVRLTASRSSALSLYYCLWKGGGSSVCHIRVTKTTHLCSKIELVKFKIPL